MKNDADANGPEEREPERRIEGGMLRAVEPPGHRPGFPEDPANQAEHREAAQVDRLCAKVNRLSLLLNSIG
jgi:hypothetical protein